MPCGNSAAPGFLRLRVFCDAGSRLLMSLVSLGLLSGAETALGVFVLGQPVATLLAMIATLAGVPGFAAQFITASFPLMHQRKSC